MENMTELTQKMYDKAMRVRSVEDALNVLRANGEFRTLGDVLRSFSGSADPRRQIVDGLMQYNPQANRESVDKKVRNWLSGKTQTIGKEDAYVLSRILELDLERTDNFLKMATGEGIHWRNPEDIVWAYSIVQGLNFAETSELLKRAAEERASRQVIADSASYTALIREKLQPVLSQGQEALLDFLRREAGALGSCHNTAHRLFLQYMNLLEYAGQEAALQDASREEKKELDSKMTSREILETYLYRQLVPVSRRGEAKEKSAFSAVQRSIRMNWPDEATISKMKSRETEITRKVMILLFLATDGSESDYEELDEDEDILTRDEIFQNVCIRLDRMLHACGFQLLDPRSHFDWMVLYCICVEDLWDVDQRLKDMLMAMFPEGNEKQ